jgi:hypothetical protein
MQEGCPATGQHAVVVDVPVVAKGVVESLGSVRGIQVAAVDQPTVCPAPGLMETSNTRRIRSHGCTTEVPG